MAFLSPLDLLTVSENEQDIIRCLVRHPRLTSCEIAKITKIPLEELDRLLKVMVKNAHLTQDDQNKFQVLIGQDKKQKSSQNGSGLLDTLFG